MAKNKPEVHWDELRASVGFRELFRYQRGLAVESYHLRPLSDGRVELWVLTAAQGSEPIRSHLQRTFATPELAAVYLAAKERSLRKARWKRLD